ncbi:MAG: hypothetical protein ACFFB2_02395 [Promethearchaeota archaeon]
MNQELQIENTSLMILGVILWMIAAISLIGTFLFSIGLFQRLTYGGDFETLELLILLLGILNASSISGSILISSRKK